MATTLAVGTITIPFNFLIASSHHHPWVAPLHHIHGVTTTVAALAANTTLEPSLPLSLSCISKAVPTS
jgi:hypothetical protein